MTANLGPAFSPERGSTWLHRLDPLVKLAWLVAVIVVAFATFHPLPLLAIAVVGLLLAASAGVGSRVARILAIFVPVTASILVIQTLGPAACAGGCTPVARLGPLLLYGEGTIRGLSLVSRLLAVEAAALAVILTMHPSDLFAALARLRVPYVPNLMLSMTLRLIPILQREFAIVLSAQRARGMQASGFAALLPSFVPVFAGAFQRVQQLTISFESRGFGATSRRTSFRQVRFGPQATLAAVAGIAAGVVGTIAGLTIWSADRLIGVVPPADVVVGVFIVAATLFAGVILLGIRSLVRA
ncbi:MAG TPA: energy-coupling factor transporter transmembrane component T [Candidatus Limnocylindrales bacterium]|jgi:energy-coupling factor transport system permease protein|nr:energy-coupling factor transporter transmembrane component T [Candidatus Limnocylindrales bacterium]